MINREFTLQFARQVSGERNSRELIEHNKNGLLSSTDGSDGYVEAVWRLVRDPSLRNRLSAAAQRSSKGYQWKSILDGVTSAYHEAISNRGSADHFSGSQSNQLPLQTERRHFTRR